MTTNIGVIGLGSFMARQHLPNIARNPDIRFHTFCDLDNTLLEKRNSEFHPIQCTNNALDVFTNPEIDAVLIGTRSNMHAKFVLMAIEHGKHVYVEKPISMTTEETRDIIEASKQSDIQIGVGFNRRFAPAMVEAKKLFQSYKQSAANIIYRIVDDHRIRPHYIFDMANGGGHLLQEACHIFDLLAWFLEAEPTEIYCIGPLETDNTAIIKYDDGSSATLVCGGKGGLFYPKELMEVFCENRTLVIDQFFEMRYDGPGNNFIKQFPLAAKNTVELPQNANMTDFYKATFASRPEKDITGQHAANDIPVPIVDKGHAQAIAAFADAITTGRNYEINAIDGTRATICALKGYESIKTGLPVKIHKHDYS